MDFFAGWSQRRALKSAATLHVTNAHFSELVASGLLDRYTPTQKRKRKTMPGNRRRSVQSTAAGRHAPLTTLTNWTADHGTNPATHTHSLFASDHVLLLLFEVALLCPTFPCSAVKRFWRRLHLRGTCCVTSFRENEKLKASNVCRSNWSLNNNNHVFNL